MNAWLSFFKDELLETKYKSKPEWTKFILGEITGNILISEKKDCFYYHLQKELGVDFKPYREDKFCDVSIYSKNQFSKVYSLHNEPEDRKDNLQNGDWYKDCLISIEHENKCEIAYIEMMNLTYRRARLKVLITYNNGCSYENTMNTFKVMAENFSNIIKQSNEYFAENRRTEYLLIVGSKLKDKDKQEYKDKIMWNCQSFLWTGQTLDKQTFYSNLYIFPGKLPTTP
jgi:hypothetical protein